MIQVRVASTSDIPQVLSLFNSARSKMTYLPVIHTENETADFIAKLVKQGNVFVTLDEEKITGFIEFQNGWVRHLYISPENQNKGNGKLLLDIAKKDNPHGLKLWVFEQNEGALKFYEREGFKVALKRNMDETDNEEGLPDRLYKWDGF